MHFLTIAEDTPYYQWQIELLIESFKMKNLEDKLFIYLIKTENSVDGIKNNINNHPNLFYYNSDRIKTCSLNFDFHQCILNYRDKFPLENFMIFDTDNLLKNIDESDFNLQNLVYQIDQKENDELSLILKLSRSKYNYSFYPMTSIVYFSALYSYDFFKSAFLILEDLIKISFFCNIDNEKHEPDLDLYKYSYLILSLMYNIKVNPSYKLLNYAYEGTDMDVNFISYKHDVKPYFYKKNYFQKDFKNLSLSYTDPFENMLDLPDFVGCSFIKSIVLSYQNFSD